jgi:hypothetical protein
MHKPAPAMQLATKDPAKIHNPTRSAAHADRVFGRAAPSLGCSVASCEHDRCHLTQSIALGIAAALRHPRTSGVPTAPLASVISLRQHEASASRMRWRFLPAQCKRSRGASCMLAHLARSPLPHRFCVARRPPFTRRADGRTHDKEVLLGVGVLVRFVQPDAALVARVDGRRSFKASSGMTRSIGASAASHKPRSGNFSLSTYPNGVAASRQLPWGDCAGARLGDLRFPRLQVVSVF